jgi:hypothetical protein
MRLVTFQLVGSITLTLASKEFNTNSGLAACAETTPHKSNTSTAREKRGRKNTSHHFQKLTSSVTSASMPKPLVGFNIKPCL